MAAQAVQARAVALGCACLHAAHRLPAAGRVVLAWESGTWVPVMASMADWLNVNGSST